MYSTRTFGLSGTSQELAVFLEQHGGQKGFPGERNELLVEWIAYSVLDLIKINTIMCLLYSGTISEVSGVPRGFLAFQTAVPVDDRGRTFLEGINQAPSSL